MRRSKATVVDVPADEQGGSLAFRRGWLATSDPIEHDIASTWLGTSLGELHLRVHPALGYVSASEAGSQVVLLGDAVDTSPDGITAPLLAARIARTLARAGSDEAVRQVAYIGGRFTCLLAEAGQITVVPDTVASLPTYWAVNGESVVLSSWAHLVAEVSGAPKNETLLALMSEARELGARGTLFTPGIETPFSTVHPLLPNHLLLWRSSRGSEVEHRRFYPWTDLPTASPEDAYERFSTLFERHVRSLCGLGRTGISLTAGLDSNATLVAAFPHLGPDALTWTYHTLAQPHDGTREDLLAANRTAVEAGLAHRIVDIVDPTDQEFLEAYRRSLRYTPQFRRLAGAYYEQLPHDLVQLQSMVAEVGTGFYKSRDPTAEATADVLAQTYANNPFGREPRVREAHERFIEYAEFTSDRFLGHDFRDLFYWESRIGRWGTLRMQECDFAHRLVLPFNDRGVVEALQQLPFEERVDKQPLARFIDERKHRLAGALRRPKRTRHRRWAGWLAP